MGNLNEFLAIIGTLTLISFGLVLIYLAFLLIDGLMGNLKTEYDYTHRFEKPPTAKCYCMDCKNHAEDNACAKFEGWYTADEWFCWDADPKTEMEENERQR